MRFAFAGLRWYGGLGVCAALLIGSPQAFALHPDASATAKKLRAITVAPHLLRGRAASALIGPAGGAVSARAPNGTRFLLRIPKGALSNTTRIVMTPVGSIGRLPFRRSIVGAVILQPEGLILSKPATLKLTPRAKIPRTLRTGFAFDTTGREFHLYFSGPGSGPSIMRVGHFSGYGAGAASKAERDQVAAHRPDDAVAAIENEVGKILSDSADAGSSPSDQSVQNALARAFLPQLQALAERVRAAESSDAGLRHTLKTALALDRQLKLVHVGSVPVDWWPPPETNNRALYRELQQLSDRIGASVFWRVFDNATDRARRRCVSDHDPAQAARIIVIDGWRFWFGGDPSEKAISAAFACLHFKLDVSGSVTDVFGSYTVSGSTDLGPTPGTKPGPISGTGVISITSDRENNSQYVVCTLERFVPGQMWAQFSIDAPLARDQEGETGEKAGPATLRAGLALNPGDAHALLHCDSILDDHWEQAGAHWWDMWDDAHHQELRNKPLLFFQIDDWQYPGTGEVFATKTYDRTIESSISPGAKYTEKVTLTLRHTPRMG